MGMPVITAGTSTRGQAITDIVSSVALEQTALSHILNAEGEKIQKAVANAKTNEELLEVNSSVQGMVNSITRLEMILQGKLELFGSTLCDLSPTTEQKQNNSASAQKADPQAQDDPQQVDDTQTPDDTQA